MNLSLIILILVVVLPFSGFSQKASKTDTIQIQTSAICGMCEERIEQGLAFEKGVKNVTLDDKTKVVTVKYNVTKTTPEKIRETISKLGYDADDVEADPKAYAKLPACCKKGVTPH